MTTPTTATDVPPPGVEDAPPPPDIGWGHAVVAAVAILVVGILGCVYLPNLIVTGTSLTPDARANLAAVVCVAVLLVLAWCLRRAQKRGLI